MRSPSTSSCNLKASPSCSKLQGQKFWSPSALTPSWIFGKKRLQLRAQMPDLILVRVSPAGTPDEDDVVDFATALAAQPDDRLTFGAARGGDDVAA